MATEGITGVVTEVVVESIAAFGGSNSAHNTLDVNHLIGPRWTEEKEKEFIKLKRQVRCLLIFSFLSNLAFFLMSAAYYLLSMSR